MLSLKGRQDGYRFLFPKNFICEEIYDKYAKILRAKNGNFEDPTDFLNETIQGIQVFGFSNGTSPQQQPVTGKPLLDNGRDLQNAFSYPATDYNYRNQISPVSLMDRTFNVIFRHTLGFLNYFIIYENFWWQFSRDKTYDKLPKYFNVEIFNEKGSVYSKIVLESPLIDSMDMLDLNFTQPVAQSQTFNVSFKYSNFDLQFIDDIDVDEQSRLMLEIKDHENL